MPQFAGKKAISGNTSGGVTLDGDQAFTFYEFIVQNSTPEWSLGAYSNKKAGMDFIISTSYQEGSVSDGDLLGRSRLDMIYHIHSHPGGEMSKEASGYDLYSMGLSIGSGDAPFMASLYEKAKGANKKWPNEYPRLYIYHEESKGLYHYNHVKSSVFVGDAKDPSTMQRLVKKHKLIP